MSHGAHVEDAMPVQHCNVFFFCCRSGWGTVQFGRMTDNRCFSGGGKFQNFRISLDEIFDCHLWHSMKFTGFNCFIDN